MLAAALCRPREHCQRHLQGHLTNVSDAASRTVKIPDGEQKYNFDVEIGPRAEHAEELEEILEAQPAGAIVAEHLGDARCKRVVEKLVDAFQLLRIRSSCIRFQNGSLKVRQHRTKGGIGRCTGPESSDTSVTLQHQMNNPTTPDIDPAPSV